MADYTTLIVMTEDLTTDMYNISDHEEMMVSDHPWLKNFRHLNVSVRFMMGLLAISGNLLTVVAIAHYEYLRSCTNYLIAALASADMFGGLNCLLVLLNHLIPMTDETWMKMCVVEMFFSLLSVGLNLVYIVLISLDRFIYITVPLRYHSLVTPRLTIGAVLFFLVIVTSQLLMSNLMIDEYQQTQGNICRGIFPKDVAFLFNLWFYVTTPITIVLYVRIAWIAYRQKRVIEQTQNVTANQEHKITKMMAMVLGVYLACYVPQFTVFGLEGYISPDLYIIIERVSSWFWWINSWANPLIYAWKNKDFNRAFRRLLHLKAPTVYPAMDHALS